MPQFVPTKTIADARAAGETALTVHCLNMARHCYHQAPKSFDELKLPDEMIFVHIPQHRPFVCTQCGGRTVKVMPIFPEKRGGGSFFSPEFEAAIGKKS
jgi:hypothetical protein